MITRLVPKCRKQETLSLAVEVLHSTPSPIEDQQPPSDPGTNREKDFPPVGLTYSAIALAVVFLLTTLLIAVALAVLIWTKGRRRCTVE